MSSSEIENRKKRDPPTLSPHVTATQLLVLSEVRIYFAEVLVPIIYRESVKEARLRALGE